MARRVFFSFAWDDVCVLTRSPIGEYRLVSK